MRNATVDKEEMEELKSAPFYIIEVQGKRPKQYSEGRKCVHCGAKLSIYNSDDECWPCQKASLAGE